MNVRPALHCIRVLVSFQEYTNDLRYSVSGSWFLSGNKRTPCATVYPGLGFIPWYVYLIYSLLSCLGFLLSIIYYFYFCTDHQKDGVASLPPWRHPPSLHTLHSTLHTYYCSSTAFHIWRPVLITPHKITPGGPHLIPSLSPAPTSHQGKFLFELFKICFWIFQIYFAVWLLFIPFAFCLSRLLLTHKKVGLFLNADAFWREKLTLYVWLS